MPDTGKLMQAGHPDSPITREMLKAQVWGLTAACPVDQDNPAGCPLHEIRLRPASARMDWVSSLGVTALQAILARHHACLRSKEFLRCFE